MLGGHAMTAITAVTAQNSQGVSAIQMLDSDLIAQQMEAVTSDFGVDAVKIGMLGTEAIISMVAAMLVADPAVNARSAAGHRRRNLPQGVKPVPIVVDPVMVASSGAMLLALEAMQTLKARLCPIATVITPNRQELAVLTGLEISTDEDARAAAVALARECDTAVLAKGGHFAGNEIVDQLASADGEVVAFRGSRIDTPHSHGTGCTLSSALAVALAEGLSLIDAVARARQFVRLALERAPQIVADNGPLGHMFVRPEEL
jgi:hydroxymethylpyrimidine/phosphomethylpyrimidine kinase